MAKELAEVFPPGEFLAEELESRGWSQSDLAQRLGVTVEVVGGIVSCEQDITEEMSALLGAVLGTGSAYWLNLQEAYRRAGSG